MRAEQKLQFLASSKCPMTLFRDKYILSYLHYDYQDTQNPSFVNDAFLRSLGEKQISNDIRTEEVEQQMVARSKKHVSTHFS